MRKLRLFWLALAAFSASALEAQDLTYRAKNPAFGGETFNYQWLLSGAQAQDTFKDPSATSTASRFSTASTLDDFAESLNRQLLSQISRQLVSSQFGEDGLQPGTYTIGNFTVDVGSSVEGVLIDIFDQGTGQSTQVVIPFF